MDSDREPFSWDGRTSEKSTSEDGVARPERWEPTTESVLVGNGCSRTDLTSSATALEADSSSGVSLVYVSKALISCCSLRDCD